ATALVAEIRARLFLNGTRSGTGLVGMLVRTRHQIGIWDQGQVSDAPLPAGRSAPGAAASLAREAPIPRHESYPAPPGPPVTLVTPRPDAPAAAADVPAATLGTARRPAPDAGSLSGASASRRGPTPSFSLIFFSISLARSGLSRRKFRAFSLPWPSWSPS